MTPMNVLKFVSIFFLFMVFRYAASQFEELHHSCSTDIKLNGNSFQFHTAPLFSSFTSANTKFYNTTVYSDETVYGLFMCRGDINLDLCHQCIMNAINQLTDKCLLSKEVVIWYEYCMIRYSNHSFFSIVDTQPTFVTMDQNNYFILTKFGNYCMNIMNKMANEAATTVLRYATKNALIGSYFVYSLAQCTQDLSPKDCLSCLTALMSHTSFCCEERIGGRAVNPSCHVRYELYPFYTNSDHPLSSPTTPPPAGKYIRGRWIGQVFKGILSNGQEIAVKKLSKSSSQGAEEFKNEVLLIARLQHRNLVALLGFCIEEQEKLLVYEYVPNRSLDYFLFGSQNSRVLDWMERSKIIGGVARGILYFHEYSRLKIIHRDLKSSNILLDDKMNPKISDFGLAKLVSVSESEGSTKRIVGTYGYMSPEYAMFGQYSEKSDVFSFGVIVLEIISRKKNTGCHDSQYADGLLSFTWKKWRDDKLVEMLDSNINELGSYNEVIKCIQIGLLCVQENANVRPSMATVVSYLSNDSIQLPLPEEPAFFLHGHKPQPIISKNRSGESCSVNEASMSEFFPR
ncbi:hypothetical protein K1719_016572 [Acacia pycnantha]|nr:hypothetical protein K1719_016572 [Acacia pycnantha]